MYHEIVLIGVGISILFYELTGYSAAGLVVAGYFALCLQSPMRILYTLVVVLLTWGITKLLSRFIILYGRRRFAVMVLISFLLDWGIAATGLLGTSPGLIGVLVPGIIAREFEKQGIWKTLLALAIVTAILALIMMLFRVPVLPVGLI